MLPTDCTLNVGHCRKQMAGNLILLFFHSYIVFSISPDSALKHWVCVFTPALAKLPVFKRKVIADQVDFSGKQLSFVFARTSRAFILSNVKNLVHSGMECISFKSDTNLIHQYKNNFMHIRMKRTIAFAIQSIGNRPYLFFRHFYLKLFVFNKIKFCKFDLFIANVLLLSAPATSVKHVK